MDRLPSHHGPVKECIPGGRRRPQSRAADQSASAAGLPAPSQGGGQPDGPPEEHRDRPARLSLRRYRAVEEGGEAAGAVVAPRLVAEHRPHMAPRELLADHDVTERSATTRGLAAAQAGRRAPAAPAGPRRHVAEGCGGLEDLAHGQLDLGPSPAAVQPLERHPHQAGGADSPAAIGAVEHAADRAPDETLGGVREAHGIGTPRHGIARPAHATQGDLARWVMRPGARKRSAPRGEDHPRPAGRSRRRSESLPASAKPPRHPGAPEREHLDLYDI